MFVEAELWVGWISVVAALRDERPQNRSSITGRDKAAAYKPGEDMALLSVYRVYTYILTYIHTYIHT